MYRVFLERAGEKAQLSEILLAATLYQQFLTAQRITMMIRP